MNASDKIRLPIRYDKPGKSGEQLLKDVTFDVDKIKGMHIKDYEIEGQAAPNLCVMFNTFDFKNDKSIIVAMSKGDLEHKLLSLGIINFVT